MALNITQNDTVFCDNEIYENRKADVLSNSVQFFMLGKNCIKWIKNSPQSTLLSHFTGGVKDTFCLLCWPVLLCFTFSFFYVELNVNRQLPYQSSEIRGSFSFFLICCQFGIVRQTHALTVFTLVFPPLRCSKYKSIGCIDLMYFKVN